MVTTRKQTTKSVAKSTTLLSNGNGKTAPNKMTETAVTPEVLAQRIQTAISRKYKILLAKREERIATKVGYAIREKLGLDIQNLVSKNNGNFDWKDWNTNIFPKILGEPTALKYPIETMARAIALLCDSISLQTPIDDLVAFNIESLKRRNSNGNSTPSEGDLDLDDLDEDIEDLLEEAVEAEDSSEGDEDEDLDDEDFEIDDED
jgi:hypothetical protein